MGYDIHFHTVEPVYMSEDFRDDIVGMVEHDFYEGHFTKEDDAFWFGVSVPYLKDIEDEDLDTLKEKVSDVLHDIPTIWSVKSVIRDKPERLIFLLDLRGPLGR